MKISEDVSRTGKSTSLCITLKPREESNITVDLLGILKKILKELTCGSSSIGASCNFQNKGDTSANQVDSCIFCTNGSIIHRGIKSDSEEELSEVDSD